MPICDISTPSLTWYYKFWFLCLCLLLCCDAFAQLFLRSRSIVDLFLRFVCSSFALLLLWFCCISLDFDVPIHLSNIAHANVCMLCETHICNTSKGIKHMIFIIHGPLPAACSSKQALHLQPQAHHFDFGEKCLEIKTELIRNGLGWNFIQIDRAGVPDLMERLFWGQTGLNVSF